MSIYQALFLGACVGWIICALCFVFIPTWRATDIVAMNDAELTKHMRDCGAEWVYRHPQMKATYYAALADAERMARSARSGPYTGDYDDLPGDRERNPPDA
jgi:hypothetical protein